MPSSIDRYIFRTTFGAFLLVLLTLTGIIWITHALREIDLITNQGQTILVFVGITGLLIPILAQVIAPIAFVIAVVYAIDKLNGDAELVVMNAAGMSPWRLFRPFLAVAITVALLVGFISAYLSPSLQRELRDRATRVRTDLVTNIVQPGRFRADLDDRLLAPIYPLAFVVIAFAAIGGPRTTRQSRGFAVALAIGGVAVLRLIGFACIVLSIQTPTALAVLYGSVIFTCT